MIIDRNKRSLLAIVAVLLFCSFNSYSQDNKSTVLQAAKSIETNDKSREAIAAREAALKWLIETEDVRLIVCGGTFDTFGDKKNKNAPDMTLAYTVGMGAFKIAHPDQANDENAAQLAGLLLALKAYEYAVQEKPKTRNDKIAALIAKRDAGELAALVSGFNCGKK